MKPKYLRVVSDLHLEQFYGQYEEVLARKFVPEDERDSSSVLLLAGDISSKPDQLITFLQILENRFQHVFFVQGNHETYGHDIDVWNSTMTARVIEQTTNVTFNAGQVTYKEMNGWRLICATLWADGGKTPDEQMMVQSSINDFRMIRKGANRFGPWDMISIHRRQKQKLEELLKKQFDGKTVVMTHHLPSYQLCHPRFNSAINGGFASDCDHMLNSDYAPSLWVYGHTHDSQEIRIGKTLTVSNPAGYRSETGGGAFNQFSPKFIALDDLKNTC
jgi:predicted phosphodiesterase